MFAPRFQPLIVALAIVFGLWVGKGCSPDRVAVSAAPWNLDGGEKTRLLHIFNRIEDLYVDTSDMGHLVDVAIDAVLEELDPHTEYFTGEELAAMSENMEGNFEGIGVEFLIQDDTLMVVSPIPGGPSEAAGIMAGDRIVIVDGESISGKGLNNQRVMDLLKGPRGTEVSLGLTRRGSEFSVELVRDRIPIQSVVATFMAEESIGYLKCIRFSASTSLEFERALFELSAQGAESLVVDLRGNGGGYLNAVVDMLEWFLENGDPIVYTEGKSSPRRNYLARGDGAFKHWPVAVLVDEGSASASEIFAGAMQDNDRGLVVGRRTFGKGLVQEEFDVPGSGALRLTVARFYTPTGRAIQKPYALYEDDFDERMDSGELFEADSMPLIDSLRYETPLGRFVFGGGGIAPDLFVPWDSTATSAWLSEWIWTGILRDAVFDWMDANREALTQCTSPSDIEALPAWGLALASLQARAELETWPWREPNARESRQASQRFLAQVVRSMWGESASYQILMQDDPGLNLATEALLQGRHFETREGTVSLTLTNNDSTTKQSPHGF